MRTETCAVIVAGMTVSSGKRTMSVLLCGGEGLGEHTLRARDANIMNGK
jgi:hypothetical protein